MSFFRKVKRLIITDQGSKIHTKKGPPELMQSVKKKSTAFKNKGYFPNLTTIRELKQSVRVSIPPHPHFMYVSRSSNFGHHYKGG